MFCQACKRGIAFPGVLYCPYCGSSLAAAETKQNKFAGSSIWTEGGATVAGNVDVAQDFVGRDQIKVTIVQSLGDVDAIQPQDRDALLACYQELVVQAPEGAQVLLSLGLFYLDLRLYMEAAVNLRKAHERLPLVD